MTLDLLLSQLQGVRPRGARWSACCPAHEDNSPSLSVAEGDRGILLRCFAGCTVQEICGSLGIKPQDLFFDALDTDPRRRRAAAQARDRRRDAIERHAAQQGTLLDALKAADDFVQSRQGLDIGGWSSERLNAELDALADAYFLLEREALHG